MKVLRSILIMAVAILGFQCGEDPVDPPPPPPAPENQPPGGFTAAVEINQNTAELSWTASADPDGDNITYSVLLEDSLVSEQTETSLALTDLVFERDYQGKIIADDGNGHQVETTFNFTTGFLWLGFYEFNNGSGDGYSYSFDDQELLITALRTPNGEPKNITYDSNGNLFAVGNMTYTHNANGLLTTISDGTGKGDLELLYDDQDRINTVKIIRTNANNNYIGNVTMTFTYDGIGNLATIDWHRRYTSDNTNGAINNWNRRHYVYDNAGNVTEFRLENSTDGVTYQESLKELFTYDFDHKDPWHSLLTRQLGFSSRVYFGIRGEFDPQSAVQYNIEGYSIRFLKSEHTLIGHKIFSSGDLILDYTYEYTYNETGYPVSGKVLVGSNEQFPKWTYSDVL
ncbi:MAG: fibronectin type III domain-containing protein [Cyclobacteriaceae bacterium]